MLAQKAKIAQSGHTAESTHFEMGTISVSLTFCLTGLDSTKQVNTQGSGCGAVDRAVASNTRGLRFDSSHRQNVYVLSTVLKKTKIKKKDAGNGAPPSPSKYGTYLA